MSDKKPTPPPFSFKFNPAAHILFGNVTLEDIDRGNGTGLTSTQLNEIAVDDEPSSTMTNNDIDKKGDEKDAKLIKVKIIIKSPFTQNSVNILANLSVKDVKHIMST